MAVTGSKTEILPGETAQYTLDLTNINGTRFLLQVYDYAMNTTTYVIDQQIGDPTALPAMIGFNVLRQYWVSLTTTSTYENAQTSYAESDGKFLASTMVDSYIFGCHLYRQPVRYASQQSDLIPRSWLTWTPCCMT